MKMSSKISLGILCLGVTITIVGVKASKKKNTSVPAVIRTVITALPTEEITSVPSEQSTDEPTKSPTQIPTQRVTERPTTAPTQVPVVTTTPTMRITSAPPTASPTIVSRSAKEPVYYIHKELYKGVVLEVDMSQIYYFEPDYDTNVYITRKTKRTEENYELLAKLLCCEAGGRYSTWEMQVWTLCAILNNLDRTNRSLVDAAHDELQYSVAGWVDDAKPDEINYRAIDFVLDGHRIAKINCFRTKYYHDFGTPIASVDGEHFFSAF